MRLTCKHEEDVGPEGTGKALHEHARDISRSRERRLVMNFQVDDLQCDDPESTERGVQQRVHPPKEDRAQRRQHQHRRETQRHEGQIVPRQAGEVLQRCLQVIAQRQGKSEALHVSEHGLRGETGAETIGCERGKKEGQQRAADAYGQETKGRYAAAEVRRS
jgi:hypothetical protein